MHVYGPDYSAVTVKSALEGLSSISINARYYDSSIPIIKQISMFLTGKVLTSMRELVEDLLSNDFKGQNQFIVLDNAESFLKFDQKALFLLARLRQLSRNNKVSILTVTKCQWCEFGNVTTGIYPRIVFCQPVSQLSDIINTPMDVDQKVFGELTKYIDNMSTKSHSNMAFRLAVLRKYGPKIFELVEKEAFSRAATKTKAEFSALINVTCVTSSTESIVNGLSLVEKYLVIASYLSASIPQRHDCKVFGLQNQRKMKAKQSKLKDTKTKKDGLQKMIPTERLLAIFYMIYKPDLPAPSRSTVLLSLAHLIDLKLILRMTSYQRIESYRYKCNFSRDLMNLVCKVCSFEYRHYLLAF